MTFQPRFYLAPTLIGLVLLCATQAATSAPILEAGALMGPTGAQARRQPLDNSLLDQLFNDKSWGASRSGDTFLLQRTDRYGSVGQFLNNLPPASATAIYNYDWPGQTKLDGYQADGQWRSLPSGLVGGWQAYTYIKDEPLSLDWQLTDNDSATAPAGRLLITTEQGQIVRDETWPQANATQLRLAITDLPEGLYRLEWQAKDDIRITDFHYTMSRSAFRGRLYLAESDSALALWLRGADLNANTVDPASLQTISWPGGQLAIDQLYKQFSVRPWCGQICALSLPHGGLSLSTNGLFSFTQAAMVGPSINKIDENFTLTNEVQYIITNYHQSVSQDGWQTAVVDFDLIGAYRHEGRYGLMITAPGLTGETQGPVIGRITAEFSGSGWRDWLKKLWPH